MFAQVNRQGKTRDDFGSFVMLGPRIIKTGAKHRRLERND